MLNFFQLSGQSAQRESARERDIEGFVSNQCGVRDRGSVYFLLDETVSMNKKKKTNVKRIVNHVLVSGIQSLVRGFEIK